MTVAADLLARERHPAQAFSRVGRLVFTVEGFQLMPDEKTRVLNDLLDGASPYPNTDRDKVPKSILAEAKHHAKVDTMQGINRQDRFRSEAQTFVEKRIPVPCQCLRSWPPDPDSFWESSGML